MGDDLLRQAAGQTILQPRTRAAGVREVGRKLCAHSRQVRRFRPAFREARARHARPILALHQFRRTNRNVINALRTLLKTYCAIHQLPPVNLTLETPPLPKKE